MKKNTPKFEDKIITKDAIIDHKSTSSPANDSKKEKKDVTIFFTEDRDLLNQYYELRHKAYTEDSGFSTFNGYENKFDKIGKIVVAVNSQGEVVGGMRLLFSNQCKYFSQEIPGTEFTYQKLIAKYDKREGLFMSEISGIVVRKDYRNRTVTKKMFKTLLEESEKHGCHYVCGIGVAVVCRDYRITMNSLGYFVEIFINYPWDRRKVYNFSKVFPMYTKLK